MAGRRTFRALGALFGGASDVLNQYKKEKDIEDRTQRLQDILGKNTDMAKYADFVDPTTGQLDPLALTLMGQEFKEQQLDKRLAAEDARYSQRMAADEAMYKRKTADRLSREKELLQYKKDLGLFNNRIARAAKPSYSPAEKRAQKVAEKFMTSPDFQTDYLSGLGYEDDVPFTMEEIAGMIERGESVPRAPKRPGWGERIGGFFGDLFGPKVGMNEMIEESITSEEPQRPRKPGGRNVLGDIDTAFSR